MLLKSKKFLLALGLAASLFAFLGASPCKILLSDLKEHLQPIYPATTSVLNKVEEFAKQHNLPMKLMNTGPEEREVPRLFVGLDITNPELMKDYMKTFNLDAKLDENAAGVLPLEFQFEHVGNYVTGVLRPYATDEEKIFRWGREDMVRKAWWDGLLIPNTRQDPIHGYAHLIGLKPDEVDNVKTFLKNPALRGKCKSDNCVAWTSSIELGKTEAAATDETRNYLFNALGMSRTMAHFEIGRRLVHAANERHAAIMVFLDGEKGQEAFKNLENFLPPDPKIPYEAVIKGLGYAPDAGVIKAVKMIPDGAKIFLPIAAGASPEAVTALVQISGQAKSPYLLHMFVNGVSEKTLKKGVNLEQSKIKIKALFLGSNLRDLYREGKVDVIPGYLSDFSRLVKNPAEKEFQYDAMIVRVSPPDAEGNCSLGPNNDMIMTILNNQPNVKVIAEINPNVPRTVGANFINQTRFTSSFLSETELAGPAVVPFTDVEKKIGEHLASLIGNESTLQIGIGNIFGGLPDAMKLSARTGIKISTEMFGDPLKQLIESGVATDAETGFAYGSTDLYKWLDHNEKVRFVETDVVNDPTHIQNIKKFHAVNTALQVDLKGDANATHGMDGLRMSSPGGQVEFMSAAARSEGGKAIIAIRSTAKGETISSISLDLYAGAVTTPSESVTHVVTEYGIAVLQGKTEEQRAIALINIAHPKFRKQLAEGAVERKLLRKESLSAIRYN